MFTALVISQLIIGIIIIFLFYWNGVTTGLLLSRYGSIREMWDECKMNMIVQIILIIVIMACVVIWILL